MVFCLIVSVVVDPWCPSNQAFRRRAVPCRLCQQVVSFSGRGIDGSTWSSFSLLRCGGAASQVEMGGFIGKIVIIRLTSSDGIIKTKRTYSVFKQLERV